MKEQEKKQIVFSEFLKNEYGKLRNYIKSLFNGGFFEVEPEDIIQDVALNVYSKLDLNSTVENVAGYFYRGIRNKIIDFQRKKNPNVSIDEYDTDDGENLILKRFISDDDTTAEENEAKYNALVHSIKQLKPDFQEIIYKTEFEEYSFAELSEMLGIPVGTLLSRKHRALKNLAEILNKTEFNH